MVEVAASILHAAGHGWVAIADPVHRDAYVLLTCAAVIQFFLAIGKTRFPK
jgi:hypothetical protein